MRSQRRYLRAGVETKEQLRACLDTPELSLIYIDTGHFKPDIWESCIESCRSVGKRCGARFPHIFRQEAEGLFEANREKLLKFDLFLLRTLEELGYVREKFKDEGERIPPLVFDYTIYAFNRESLELISGLKADTITLPLELNFRELKGLLSDRRIFEGEEGEDKLNTELTVYGRIPMMVTAQCIKKTVSGCDKKESILYLKDRTGSMMPVKNCCSCCYNTVYNSKPTMIYDLRKEIEALSPDFLRLEFTTESYEETLSILRDAVKDISELKRGKEYTGGHFKRGVE